MNAPFLDMLPRKARAKSFFIIRPHIGGGFLIDVARRGRPAHTVFCANFAEANRARLKLSSDGLVGFVFHNGGPTGQ